MSRQSTIRPDGQWYRGQTHAHTWISDGRMKPEELVATYRGLDFDFLAITDHRRYGVHAQLNREDFLLIPGIELDVPGKPGEAITHHIVGLARPGADGWGDGQKVDYPETTDVNEIIRELSSRGHYTIYAHPFWSHTMPEALDKITGFDAVEISNYGCLVEGLTGRSEMHCQRMLWQGRRFHVNASDDTHQHVRDYGGGYVVVRAAALTHEAIMEAMAEGSYYATEGPEIHDFYIEDGFAYLETSPCRSLGLYSDGFHNAGMSDEAGQLTSFKQGIPLKGARYVQAVLADAQGRRAWSQPIWLD